ncbi:MAG: hypothetical protein PHY92_09300, partial [Alphaproteobacteria bacterium]|nr:hypothetical protein [Alphaproteobacteria bacterium]
MYARLVAALGVFLLFNCAPAAAESVVLTDACSVLGATHMLDDNTGVAICALVTGNADPHITCAASVALGQGGCKWKSMSGGGGCNTGCTVDPPVYTSYGA